MKTLKLLSFSLLFFAAIQNSLANLSVSFTPSLNSICLQPNTSTHITGSGFVQKGQGQVSEGYIYLYHENTNGGLTQLAHLGYITSGSWANNQFYFSVSQTIYASNGNGKLLVRYQQTSGGVNVTAQNQPSVKVINLTVTSNRTICNGQSVSLNASGSQSYAWSPSNGLNKTTGSTVIASPSSTTTYTVTGECGFSKTVTVTVTPLPSLSLSMSAETICIGQSVQLTASGADTYQWSDYDNGFLSTYNGSSTNTATPAFTNSYFVRGTKNGCSSTRHFMISVHNFEIQSNVENICIGGSANLFIPGAGINDPYNWSPANTLNKSTGNSVIATPTSTTTYSATRNYGSCSLTRQKTITTRLCGDSFADPNNLGELEWCGYINVIGTTSGFSNNYPNQPSPDVFYKMQIYPEGGTNFSAARRSGINVMFHLLDGNGNLIQSGQNFLHRNLHQWSDYYIVVEGVNSTHGNYDVAFYRGQDCPRIAGMDFENEEDGVTIETENASFNDIVLYPNPAEGQCALMLPSLGSEAKIEIYNTTGNLVSQISTSTKETIINTSSFDKGIYLVRVYYKDQIKTIKLSVL
ncbi:MAG: T9SS type A sorting domain-containing protein [Cytophagaceae bacterium]